MPERRNKKKKSFVLFYNKVERLIENYNIEEIGELFRAVAIYELYGTASEFPDRSMRMIYQEFIEDLDEKMNSYIEKCEINKANRSKGKIKKGTPEAEVTSGDESCNKDNDNGKANDNDIDNGKVNVNDIGNDKGTVTNGDESLQIVNNEADMPTPAERERIMQKARETLM